MNLATAARSIHKLLSCKFTIDLSHPRIYRVDKIISTSSKENKPHFLLLLHLLLFMLDVGLLPDSFVILVPSISRSYNTVGCGGGIHLVIPPWCKSGGKGGRISDIAFLINSY